MHFPEKYFWENAFQKGYIQKKEGYKKGVTLVLKSGRNEME
jgi:hypothetical protein